MTREGTEKVLCLHLLPSFLPSPTPYPHAKPSWHLQNHLLSIPVDSRTILKAIWLQKAVLWPFTKISRKSSPRTPGGERVFFFFLRKQGLSLNFPSNGFTATCNAFVS